MDKSFYIFTCRVNAPDHSQAQDKVIALLSEHGLSPLGRLPDPKPSPVQYGDDTLWQCYAKCEVVA